MPLEGSVRGAPKPGDVIKGEVLAEERERNMYFSAIGFINDVKTGPFWEHSPILFDISGVQDGWGKINKVSLPASYFSSASRPRLSSRVAVLLSSTIHGKMKAKWTLTPPRA